MRPRRRVVRPTGRPGEVEPCTGEDAVLEETSEPGLPWAEDAEGRPESNDERLRRDVPPHWGRT
jgi:hypothetical protein